MNTIANILGKRILLVRKNISNSCDLQNTFYHNIFYSSSYNGGHYPDNRERAHKRPPSVSSHVSPQLFNGLILQHKIQIQGNEGAVYVKAGGPVKSHYIVHPDWHLEPVH